MSLHRALAVPALVFALALGLGACAGSPAQDASPLPAGTVVVDVRTPGEFAEGHLDGAVNIDAAVDTSKAFGLRSNGNFIAFSTGNLALAVYDDFAVMINPGDRVHVTALLGLGIGEGLKLRR